MGLKNLTNTKELDDKLVMVGREFVKQIEEVVYKIDFPVKHFIKKEKFKLYDLLLEDSVYKVMVQVSASNVEHMAILHTGFKNGNYWIVYNNSYDNIVNFKEIYSIRILEYLCKLK